MRRYQSNYGEQVNTIKSLLSICLLIPATAFTAQAPAPSATPILASGTDIQQSSTLLIPATAAVSSTALSQPVAVTPAPVAPVAPQPAAVKPAPKANLGVESCRKNFGFYGMLLGVAAGVPLSRRNHDSMTIIYSIVGGWALGTLTSYFVCN